MADPPLEGSAAFGAAVVGAVVAAGALVVGAVVTFGAALVVFFAAFFVAAVALWPPATTEAAKISAAAPVISFD